jgi:hypothetical protein
MSDKSRIKETVELITFFLLIPVVAVSGISRLIKMRKDIQLPNKDMWE